MFRCVCVRDGVCVCVCACVNFYQRSDFHNVKKKLPQPFRRTMSKFI